MEAPTAVAKIRLSPNMNGYEASTKVPKKKFTAAPEPARARSPLVRGFTALASVIPRLTMTRPTMSTAPKKLWPFCPISSSTSGRITEW